MVRIQQTHQPCFHILADCFRECVCSAWSCWGGISICVWIAVLALEKKVGGVCLATWVEVSAVPTDLITFRNPTPCLTLAPEHTACHLQITTIILLTQRSAEVGASTADCSWTQGGILGKCLTSSFYAVIRNRRMWPRPPGSCAEAWSLSSYAQSKVTAVLAVVREEGLCTNYLKDTGTFSNGWVWGFCAFHLTSRNKNAQQNCGL